MTLIFLYSVLVSLPSFAQEGRSATAVTVTPLEKKTFADRIQALGTLRADESVEITASVADKIGKIHFTDGQVVEEGEVLIEMASNEEEALLNEAMAAEREARKQLNRIRPLLKSGAVARSVFDERNRDYLTAKARFQAVKSRLSDLIIEAPFSGRVGLRRVSVGKFVQPGEVLATLTKSDPMKLDFSVPATYLGQLIPGLRVNAETSAYPGEVFQGEITSIDNSVDPVTRSVAARALIPNEDGRLIQGLLMSINILRNERRSLALPEEALISEGTQDFVFVLGEEDNKTTVIRREVEIGTRDPGRLEVLQGLKNGDQVVRDGVMKLEDGDPVKVIEGIQKKSKETLKKERELRSERAKPKDDGTANL